MSLGFHSFLLLLCGAALIAWVRLGWSGTTEQRRRVALSAVILVLLVEVSWTYLRVYRFGIPWRDNLPLHISDFALLWVLVGLLTESRLSKSLSYFAGISGATLGLFFPHIQEPEPFRLVAILRFFFTHGLILAAAGYLSVGLHFRPKASDFKRAYAITILYGISLIPLNTWLGTNYFYTQTPPGNMPLWMHHLPQPVYFAGACAFFLGLFILLYVARRWLPADPNSDLGGRGD